MPKFRVYYDRHMSTVGQEIDISRDVEMEFDQKPTRKDFQRIEHTLQDDFLKRHRKYLKKLINIEYKVKKVILIS